ncbi:MAG: hypothetical protein IJB93_02435 [Clostridia bacterium]|nr:hypothetical protein [Clostridia bacterium]
MKTFKKITALILTVVMLSLIVATPVSAASKVDPSEGPLQKLEAYFYMLLDKLVMILGKFLNTVIPGLDWGKAWQNYDDYRSPDTFYVGEEKFDTTVAPDAEWSMGYSYNSLLEGLDVLNGEYFMAGALQAVKGQVPTEVLDDQGVNVYAISDGKSGIVVEAVIDGYGFARGDVLEIRKRLSAFAEEKGIISINISTLHQHSLIDTLGMGVALVPALFLNPGMSIIGTDVTKFKTGKTQKFMDNLFRVVSETITEAVNDMEAGTLYYGSADAEDLMYDKRKPIIFDGEIHRFRFNPKNEASDEIWVCEAGIHCTTFSSSDTAISSDYPYYLREYIKEATGADVVFVQGAELAITSEKENFEPVGTGAEVEAKGLGIALAKKVMGISNEVALDPVLNIKMHEVTIKADNPIHILAVREGILNSVVAKDCTDTMVITEVGYMELGNKVGIAMIPGEISPEILWGGVISKEDSWTKTSWDFAPMKDTAKIEKLICFGLTNDQIGYILPDNDIRSMFTENEEINACSVKAGSIITSAFESLVASVK